MNCRSCRVIVALFGSCLLTVAAVAQDAVSITFKFSGEYLAEETFIGSADVRSGATHVRNFDEHDSIVRFVLTPRTKFGLLRLGVEWERFSFDFHRDPPLPDTLQEVSLVIGLDTQISDSILLRFEVQPGIYGTDFDDISEAFNAPFLIGGTYIYNSNLQFVAGVSVDIEREYPVLPAAGVRWKVARQWVLNAVLPTPRIEYEL